MLSFLFSSCPAWSTSFPAGKYQLRSDFSTQGNKFGEAGAKLLAQVLEHDNQTLQKLYVGYNAVGEFGANAFVKTLRTNTTLTMVTPSFYCSCFLRISKLFVLFGLSQALFRSTLVMMFTLTTS